MKRATPPKPARQGGFRRRGPIPAAQGAAKPLRAVAAARGFAEMRVLTEWDAVIGPALAGRCAPVRLRKGGTLVIAAEGMAALEIQHARPQIIERLNACYGYGAVRRIAIEQRAIPPRARPAPPRRRAPTGAEKARVADTVDGITDETLLAALSRLGENIITTRREGET